MPRLQHHEPPQQGVSDGGVRLHGDDSPRKKRKRAPEEPLGAGRASRAKAAKPAAKRAGALTKDAQAALLLEYKELPPKMQRGSRGHTRLCKKYGVSKNYPTNLAAKVRKRSSVISLT